MNIFRSKKKLPSNQRAAIDKYLADEGFLDE